MTPASPATPPAAPPASPLPYYADDLVTLYLGDCREVTAWLEAGVLVTDPPYGRGTAGVDDRKCSIGRVQTAAVRKETSIAGDGDTVMRDTALVMWGKRPAVIFGDLRIPVPKGTLQVLAYRKPPDAGFRSTAGFRRDLEAICLLGLPSGYGGRTSVIESGARMIGGQQGPAGRYGHPHAKPVDVMEQLIQACPPGVIADPFAGSGSTLIAARNLGRRAIGVEAEERYCELAARRLAQQPLAVGGPDA